MKMVSVLSQLYWATLGFTGLYLNLLGCTRLYWKVLDSTGLYFAGQGVQVVRHKVKTYSDYVREVETKGEERFGLSCTGHISH